MFRLAAIVATVASVAVIAGCAAGQHAETAEEVPVVDGVSADSGPVGIRDAGINPPSDGTNLAAGNTATLQLVLINRAQVPDQLTGVTVPSSYASSAVISISGPIEVPSATPGSTASASPSASPGASASPGGSASQAITMPGSSAVQVGYNPYGPSVTLVGLAQTLYPATNVPVMFTFRSGQTIEAVLPVKLTSSSPPAPTASVSASGG
jgi:hypothetical protein